MTAAQARIVAEQASARHSCEWQLTLAHSAIDHAASIGRRSIGLEKHDQPTLRHIFHGRDDDARDLHEVIAVLQAEGYEIVLHSQRTPDGKTLEEFYEIRW